jgi:uncharacterized protein (TIRG00374 family)
LKLSRIFGIVLGVGLLAWVLTRADLSEVGTALASARLVLLVPVLLVLLASYVVRTVRWRLLFPRETHVRAGSLFGALMVSYLLNNVLPARAGDLLRAYLLGEREAISKSATLGTIVIERTVDLSAALVLLLVVAIAHPLPERLSSIGLAVGLVCGVLIAMLVVLSLAGAARVEAVIRRVRLVPAKIRATIGRAAGGFIGGISGLRSARGWLAVVAATALIWSVEITGAWLVGQAFGLPLPWSGALLVLLAIGIGTALPAAPGYVGTFEFFGMAAFAALGLQGESALAFVLALHAMTFLVSSGIGALCLGMQRWPVFRSRVREEGTGDP